MKTHVLICCHNGERFISDQLKSILNQSINVDKIWIFDFNSTDLTVKIALEFVAVTPQVPIQVIKEPDAPGASLSFFRAFEYILPMIEDGDCIFLCDQDDVWLPVKVETVLGVFRRLIANPESSNDLAAVFHDIKIVDENLNPLSQTYYTGDPFAIPRDLDPDRLLLANPVVGHTLAVSGSLLKLAVRGLKHQATYLMHDWALVLLVSRAGRIDYIPEPLSLYRQHDNNLLGAFGRRRLRDTLRRTSQYSSRVVNQAFFFSQDWQELFSSYDLGSKRDLLMDRSLDKIRRHAPWLAFPLLATCAIVRGPTLKRRGLGLFILLSGLRQLVRKSS